MTSNTLEDLLEKHSPDVTSYDAGDIHGCMCQQYENAYPYRMSNEERWATYYKHVAKKVDEFYLEKTRGQREIVAWVATRPIAIFTDFINTAVSNDLIQKARRLMKDAEED